MNAKAKMHADQYDADCAAIIAFERATPPPDHSSRNALGYGREQIVDPVYRSGQDNRLFVTDVYRTIVNGFDFVP